MAKKTQSEQHLQSCITNTGLLALFSFFLGYASLGSSHNSYQTEFRLWPVSHTTNTSSDHSPISSCSPIFPQIRWLHHPYVPQKEAMRHSTHLPYIPFITIKRQECHIPQEKSLQNVMPHCPGFQEFQLHLHCPPWEVWPYLPLHHPFGEVQPHYFHL